MPSGLKLGETAVAGLPVIASANPRPGDVPFERLYQSGEALPTAQPVVTSETGIYRFPVLPAGSLPDFLASSRRRNSTGWA